MKKALLTQITQIYSKIKARENSYSDTGNDSKLNKSNNQTEEAEDNKNGHDKNIDSKEKIV